MGIKTRKRESLWIVPLKAAAMVCTAIFLMLFFLADGFSLAKAQQEPQGLTEAQDQASSTPSEVPVLPIDEIEPNGQEPQGLTEAQDQASSTPSEVPPLDEIEPNDIEPQAIPSNANVRGQLSSALDQDLYRVSLPSIDQLFTITLSHNQTAIPSSISGFPVGWRVTLYGPIEKGVRAYELVFGARTDKESATRSIGLNFGTYLIRVSPPFNIPITGYADLPYTLEVRTEPLGNVRDIEPNDDIATRRGRVLALDGTIFQGWLQQANDVDYYRMNIVNLTTSGEVVDEATVPYYLTIETDGKPQASPYLEMLESRTCTTGRVSIFAQNDLTNPASSFCLIRGKKVQVVLHLDSGAYYIRIDRPIPVGDAYSYTIQLEESSF